MNTELLKKLKDAGFPQVKCTLSVEAKQTMVEQLGDWAHCPTLSELIEACGDVFHSLEQIPVSGGWRTEAFVSYENLIEAKGRTPEEAVAKLWLALQKNK